MPAHRVLCLVLFLVARPLGLVFLVLCLVLLLVAFRVLVFPVRARQVPCLVLERRGLAPRGCPVCPDPLWPRLRLRACQASFLVSWPRECPVLGQSQARFLALWVSLALWASRVQVDPVCLVGKAPLAPPCPRPCLAARAPRVLMPPMGNLAQLMAQLVLALRLPRMGGYLPAAQHGPLSQRPARLAQVRPGQARLARGRLGRVGLELQAPWLRRRRKITWPH
mgnify:FL=1